MERRSPWVHPHTIRSRLVLECASELVGFEGWPQMQAKIALREQGAENWPTTLFASDSPATIPDVASGRVQVAIINPAMILNMATRGAGPFKNPLALRLIAVIPSFDQMVFAVKKATGLMSIAEIGERRFPLKMSLRGQKDHSLHLITNEVLSAAGFSLNDIVKWGGEVRYDPGMPYESNRIGAVEREEINAIFDEGATSWGNMALDLGMRFLPIENPLLKKLEQLGLRRGLISKSSFPKLTGDVPTLDFSGWPIYTYPDAPDELIAAFCKALHLRKDRIPWQGKGPLPIEKMVRDTAETPVEISFHPAAERCWRDYGYLP